MNLDFTVKHSSIIQHSQHWQQICIGLIQHVIIRQLTIKYLCYLY